MTAATATPQVMRDRLLQAIDGQSNICNMVVVMEVISYLEKYPITKEALEETRLGKLINDVRKKTKNEDLAKRAKKLLRSWQKLIEPESGEALSKGHPVALRSANGAALSCIPAAAAAAAAPASGKTAPELKSRNDFNNCALRVEKPSSRKRKGELTEGQLLAPAKIAKTTLSDKTQNANGIGVGAESFIDAQAHQLLDKEIPEPLDNDRLSKIPVNAVKPHPTAPGHTKPPSTSSLLKASVLQQQARQEQAASRGRYRPRSPRCSLHSPQTPKQEAAVKQSSPKAQSVSVSSPSVRCGAADSFGLGPAPQPFSASVQGFHADGSRSADAGSLGRLPDTLLHASAASSCSDAVTSEHEGPVGNTGKRKRQKYRSKDCAVSLDGQPVEDDTKPVRLKDRRLTFDPVTGQIKTSFSKDPFQEGEVRAAHGPDLQWSEPLKQSPPVLASPFQQTDWKELSRSEIIQSYLSQQSNVLTSSGAHTPGAHFFMTEFLKKEEHKKHDTKKTHVLVSQSPPRDLPGVSREVSGDDVKRLHGRQWCGVNGCYDTKGAWYDWTECISLDPHGDESRLNILPYVCTD